ncbi:N-acetylmuramoyl-L-alanine amidase [Streptomyces iconiensis]|uniref:N-acetylmuramoyl-L-alanine amidase n=1 Tax=Streptomyces iconiensis TaxID=1384038 RepID=A0ABT7A940_9ACTN|nr:N-acetylmuramoyl-L-alanine amidase [Streptomyces iconiensis]MDJ1137815.1 N-acetylmuramoyl-L-alanine amidase [Streptomyces iconiensis]
MRANLATSIGVATAAALLLPLAPFAPLAAATGDQAAPPDPARTAGAPGAAGATGGAGEAEGRAGEAQPSGGTQSLSFTAGDSTSRTQGGGAEPGTREIGARTVRPYALLGVVWERGDEELHGTVRVRTRDANTGRWSGWHELETHPADAAGAEGKGAADSEVRGATAPLWVGDSDGVQAQIVSERAAGRALRGHQHTSAGAAAPGHPRTDRAALAANLPDALPKGLSLELIDPGPEPPTSQAPASQPSTSQSPAPNAPTSQSPAPNASVPQSPAPNASAPHAPVPQAPDTAGPDTAGPDTAGPGTAGSESARPQVARPEAARPDAGNAQRPAPGPSAGGSESAVPKGSSGAGSDAAGTEGAGAEDDADAAERLAASEAARGAALPELTREATAAEYASSRPFIGPRPRIVTRKGWGANERIRESGHAYTKTVRAAFIHHTAMSNKYRCAQVPSIIRGIYRFHVLSSKWRDIGYNFLVDKCGTVYEGRSGGVAKPVMGAHTYGFNSNSTGIAVLGSFNKASPSAAAVDAISRLTAWKLGLFGINPGGRTTLVSGGGTKHKKGKKVSFRTISGHRDGFNTACPGARLYGKLGAARTTAAKLQGR